MTPFPDPVPVVGIPSCVRHLEGRPFHGVGERYIEAVLTAMHAIPLMIPAIGLTTDMLPVLDHIDALLVPGSQSMVCPSHYGTLRGTYDHLYDEKRDATALPLIREAVRRGMPLLCICRGLQEMNVAFGGTLHQNLADLPGTLHHADKGFDVSPESRFGSAHTVRLKKDGYLSSLSPLGEEFWVNSLHSQAICDLAPDLEAEAVAADGIIEAVRARDVPGFAVGIQWHPEWRAADNPFSKALFGAFVAAARAYARQQLPLVSFGESGLLSPSRSV
jgi:putative glutamine amidotransferase